MYLILNSKFSFNVIRQLNSFAKLIQTYSKQRCFQANQLTFKILELFDGLMHSLESVGGISLNILGINTRDGIIHPAVMPSHPIRGRDP